MSQTIASLKQEEKIKDPQIFEGRHAGALVGVVVGVILAVLATAAFEWSETSCLLYTKPNRLGCFDGWQGWRLRWLKIGFLAMPIAAMHTAQLGWLTGWWLDKCSLKFETAHDAFRRIRPVFHGTIPILAIGLSVFAKYMIVLRDMSQAWWIHLVAVTFLGGVIGIELVGKLLALPQPNNLHTIYRKITLVLSFLYLIATLRIGVWLFYGPLAFLGTAIAFLIFALIATLLQKILRQNKA